MCPSSLLSITSRDFKLPKAKNFLFVHVYVLRIMEEHESRQGPPALPQQVLHEENRVDFTEPLTITKSFFFSLLHPQQQHVPLARESLRCL